MLARFPTSFRRHPDATCIFAIALVAVALRLAFTGRAPAFLIGDSENYFLPAYELARSGVFDPELRRTPLYPLFIAWVVGSLGEDLQALMLAQHAMGALTCLLAYLLGRMTFGLGAGLAGGLLSALSGASLLGEHTIMAEALFTPLLVGHIALLIFACRRRSLWAAIVAGFVLGLAILARPVGLAWVVVLPFALLLAGLGFKHMLGWSAVTLGAAVLVLAPWMLRNQIVHGSFSADGSLGQTLVGRTLRHDRGFVFYDPQAPPDADLQRDRARRIMQESVGRTQFLTPVRRRIMAELGISESEANRLMRDLAIEAILRQPGYYIQSTALNFVYLAVGVPERLRDYWATRSEARNREEWENQPAIRHLLGPPTPAQERERVGAEFLTAIYQPARWGLLLIPGWIVGTRLAAARSEARPAILMSMATLVLLGVATALVAPLARYRLPVEPLIAVVAAGGLIEILRWARSRVHQFMTPPNKPPSSLAIETR